MSDLISRSAVINVIMYGNAIPITDREKLKQRINNLTTACDIDEIVERLKKYQWEYSSGLGKFTDELVDRVLRNAIEIVKGGGVNEIKN